MYNIYMEFKEKYWNELMCTHQTAYKIEQYQFLLTFCVPFTDRSSLAHQTIIQEEKKHLNKDDDVLGGDQLPRAQVLGSLP